MNEVSSKQGIIKLYKPTLQAIGVDFSNYEINDYIEMCNFDLENKLRAIIAWYVYLLVNKKHLPDPNQIFIQAFEEEWKPRFWNDKYLQQFATSNSNLFVDYRVKQKLDLISFFEDTHYQVKDYPLSVCFYEYHEGENRMIWQIDIDDFFTVSPKKLIERYIDKSNTKGEEYLEQLQKKKDLYQNKA